MSSCAIRLIVVILENGIDYGNTFPASILECLPTTWNPTLDGGREDYTDKETYSIDPEGCTDIDDALHCKKIGEGLYEVGVHIADVSHFVRPGTEL